MLVWFSFNLWCETELQQQFTSAIVEWPTPSKNPICTFTSRQCLFYNSIISSHFALVPLLFLLPPDHPSSLTPFSFHILPPPCLSPCHQRVKSNPGETLLAVETNTSIRCQHRKAYYCTTHGKTLLNCVALYCAGLEPDYWTVNICPQVCNKPPAGIWRLFYRTIIYCTSTH